MHARVVSGLSPESVIDASTGTLKITHFIKNMKAGIRLMRCSWKMVPLRQLGTSCLHAGQYVGGNICVLSKKKQGDQSLVAALAPLIEEAFPEKVVVEDLSSSKEVFVNERRHVKRKTKRKNQL